MKRGAILLMIITIISACNINQELPEITVTKKVLNPVNDHLFGQFMEKCSWGGEIGGDLVINPTTGTFDPLILSKLKAMNIPNLRYPGGTDVDYYRWTDMIDHAPEQSKRKPYYAYRSGSGDSIVSDHRLGVNEFLNLCEILEAEPILVLNIGDAYHGNMTIEQAKSDAAALWKYCNKKVDTGDPWPGYRKMNGREDPWGVKYFEIGNEYWGFKGFQWKHEPADPGMINHLFNCIKAVSDTLHALDPAVKIIVDGPLPQLNQLFEEHMSDDISYIVFHPYLPWGVNEIKDVSGNVIDPNSLESVDLWNAWVSTPAIDSTTGFSKMFDDRWTTEARSTSFPVACTEWNWNGWLGGDPKKADLIESDLAKGIGAAGFLHSFMREGDKIKMAMQSMLLGKSWGITGIRIDPDYEQDPVYLPSLQVTGLYSNYHGNSLLEVNYKGIPYYNQPLEMNALKASNKVASLDILATRSDDELFIHVINRDYNKSYDVKTNFEGLEVKKEYRRYTLSGDKTSEISNKILQQTADIQISRLKTKWGNVILDTPASSVSVFVFDIKQ